MKTTVRPSKRAGARPLRQAPDRRLPRACARAWPRFVRPPNQSSTASAMVSPTSSSSSSSSRLRRGRRRACRTRARGSSRRARPTSRMPRAYRKRSRGRVRACSICSSRFCGALRAPALECRRGPRHAAGRDRPRPSPGPRPRSCCVCFSPRPRMSRPSRLAKCCRWRTICAGHAKFGQRIATRPSTRSTGVSQTGHVVRHDDRALATPTASRPPPAPPSG